MEKEGGEGMMEELEYHLCAGCKQWILKYPVRDMQSINLQWHTDCLAKAITRKSSLEANQEI